MSNLDSFEAIGLMADEGGTSFLDDFLDQNQHSILLGVKVAIRCEVERGPCRLRKSQRPLLNFGGDVRNRWQVTKAVTISRATQKPDLKLFPCARVGCSC